VGSLVVSPALQNLLAPYEPVHAIGSRPGCLYVVRQLATGARPRLLVAECFAGAVAPGSNGVEKFTFLNEARRISTLASPNVARVRELVVRENDLLVFWDFIDGEKLVETWLSKSMPLEVALRLILDVLSGVGAIHALRDPKQQPMHLAHGELSTATIVLGVDGVARVLHAIARRQSGARVDEASLGYLAPEVHEGKPYDARADVFSAGVLLWEALSGRRLFADPDATAIVAGVRSGGIAPAGVPDRAPWAQGLVSVAAKALAAMPDDRWATTAAMAAEVRKVAGLKLASAVTAATFAKTALGEGVTARRERLESQVPLSSPAPDAMSEQSEGANDQPSSDPPANVDVALAPQSLPPSARASVIPPAPAPAMPSPPPLPARALLPSRPAAGLDDANGAPQFAPAVDVPISIAPPSSDSFEVAPTSIEPPDGGEPDGRASRRRRMAVLGGVAALGLIVVALAGWRVAHKDDAPLASTGARARAVAPPDSRPRQPLASSVHTADAPSVPIMAVPSIAAAPPNAPHSPAMASAAPAHKPPFVVPPLPKPPVASQPRARRAPISHFDPNSL
jgi:hypothetical protein